MFGNFDRNYECKTICIKYERIVSLDYWVYDLKLFILYLIVMHIQERISQSCIENYEGLAELASGSAREGR